MSRSSRPVSMRSAIVIRRAQEAQRRMRELEAAKAPPRRRGFSLAALFGAAPRAANEDEVEPRKRAA